MIEYTCIPLQVLFHKKINQEDYICIYDSSLRSNVNISS